MNESMVSIIMATYNSDKYLRLAVDSIFNQIYQSWELIVVDDCSVDETQRVILNLAERDSRISFHFNKKNSGAAVSRNKAISMARGRFLAFLDSDDLWAPEKLSLQLSEMKNDSLPITFTSYELMDAFGVKLNREVDVDVPICVGYKDLLAKRVTFGCSTVMIDRELVGEVAMPLLRTGQDYATWLSILKRGHVATRIDRVLTAYRITPGSISRNKLKKALRQWQIYTQVEGLGFLQALYYMFHYARRAVFRC